MTRLLNRMVEDKLLKKTKLIQNAPVFYSLPKIKALNLHNFRHEFLCGEIYVAYETSGLLQDWGKPEHYPDYNEYIKLGVKPDRLSVINRQIIFWEIDRGTEILQKIRDKVDKYLLLSRNHPGQKFSVIITASPGRAKSILFEVLGEIKKRDVWFFCASQDQVAADPLGNILASPIAPDVGQSLLTLD
jgi:hypothetical protein